MMYDIHVHTARIWFLFFFLSAASGPAMTRAGLMDYTVCSRYIPGGGGGGGIRVASERDWPGAYSVSHSERLGANVDA